MSFKRDGDDSGLLKNLQYRRVSEILGDHIPDDEAKLLSNGRLTCTVCSRRPIFDTIPMLSMHRKGKKHLYELSRYLQYKRDMDYKKAKQTQRSFLKTEHITIEPTLGSHNKKKSYNSVLGKKFALDITDSCDRIKTNVNPSSTASANSQVRRYLKSLSRKRPLEKVVNKLRETYGGSVDQSEVKVELKSESRKGEECVSSSKNEDVECKIKLLESGWIQDDSGKWVKDPNVEFDSDEEEPKMIP